MQKVCQSCGMPLTMMNLGTEKDGEESTDFCKNCYQDGEYLEPDLSFNEMLERGLKGLKEKEIFFLLKWMLIKGYPYQLAKMGRWKRKETN